MALITGTAHTVYIPHEASNDDGGPHWVEIRKLSGAEMDEAQASRMATLMERMGSLMTQMSGIRTPSEDADKDTIESRRQLFDPDVLIGYALVAWSYTTSIDGSPGAQLDAVTRDWLWDVIVEENTRPPVSSPGGGPS